MLALRTLLNNPNGSPPVVAGDPLFGYTPLLAHFDGSNGSTTITDSSAQALSMTAMGNAALSTAQFKFGTASLLNSTNSTSSSVYAPSGNSTLQFGGDFTISWWVYFTANNPAGEWDLFDIGYDGVNGHPYILVDLEVTSTTQVTVYIGSTTPIFTEALTAVLNTWHYYSLQRSGTTVTLTRDGVVTGTATNSTNVNPSATFTIGGRSSASGQGTHPFKLGYIDEFRVTNGFARDYNPATQYAPPTSLPGTSVSADISYPFVDFVALYSSNLNDQSSNAATATAFGSAALGAPTIPPPNGASQVLITNGSSKYLTYPSATYWAMAADFTIEFYVFPTAATAGSIVSQYPSNTAPNWSVFWNNGPIRFIYNNTNLTSSGVVPQGAWAHVAVCRQGGTITIFINGVPQGTASYSGTVGPTTQALYVGNDAQGDVFAGQISGLRITNSIARYPGFATPTAAFGTSTSSDPWFADVELLAPFSTNLNDVSQNAFTGTSHGSAAVGALPSTAPNGQTNGIVLNGVNQTVSFPSSTVFVIGTTTDFTYETFFYRTSAATVSSLFDQYAISPGIEFVVTTGGAIEIIPDSGTGAVITVGGLVLLNTWYHFAVTRKGTTLIIWLNGAIVKTVTDSSVWGNSSNPMYIGSFSATNNWFAGYIVAPRITVGYARYPNFAVPTQAFPTRWYDGSWNYTNLLAQFQNNLTDASLQGQTLSTVGTTAFTTSNPPPGGATYSLSLATGNNGVTAANTALNQLGATDFTLEGWLYPSSASGGAKDYISWNVSTSGFMGFSIQSNSGVYDALASSAFASWDVLNTNIALTSAAWNHIAYCRIGGTVYLYLNGALVTSAIISGSFATPTTINAFGYGNASGAFNPCGTAQYYDWRFTKGIGRYPTSFVPPLAAFPTTGS